jgi:MFS family permease
MVVLTDISPPGKRGKTLSLGSFVWGLASVIGPTFGGFVVTYFSWRWIFFINIPLGILSLLGIYFYLVEIRQKTKDAAIDYLGVLTMTTAIIALLTAFLIGGRTYEWISPQILGLLLVAVASSLAFIHVEINAREPILSLQFFRGRGFSAGNGVSFFSSFAIFSLFGFSPLYIQGTLAKSPMQLGFAMLALSFGWSAGALMCGQLIHLLHKKPSVLLGASLLVIGCALTLTFTSSTSLLTCIVVFGIIGLGMGFVSIASLIVVQDSLQTTQVGVATGSHQFARSVGGTLGIGLCGSLVTAKLSHIFDTMQNSGTLADLSAGMKLQIQQNFENLFRPEVQSRLEPELLDTLQAAVGQGVMLVNWVVLLAALIAFSFSLRIPSSEKRS